MPSLSGGSMQSKNAVEECLEVDVYAAGACITHEDQKFGKLVERCSGTP